MAAKEYRAPAPDAAIFNLKMQLRQTPNVVSTDLRGQVDTIYDAVTDFIDSIPEGVLTV